MTIDERIRKVLHEEMQYYLADAEGVPGNSEGAYALTYAGSVLPAKQLIEMWPKLRKKMKECDTKDRLNKLRGCL